MNMISEENGINPALFAEAQLMMKKRFGEMISYYLEDVETYIGEIRAGLEAQNAQAIYPAAHTIKSSSKQLGVLKVSDIAKDIELTGRGIAESGNGDYSTIEARLQQLEEAFGQSMAALKEFLEKWQAV